MTSSRRIDLHPAPARTPRLARTLATVTALGVVVVAGCVATGEPGAREYLDERTAATVTVAAHPLVFARERPEYAVNARDYLTLVPVDVNRAGTHAQYFYGYAWSTIDKRAAVESVGQFELVADGRTIPLAATTKTPHELGFGSPPVEPPARAATALLVPVSREILRFVAHARDLRVLRTRDGIAERFDVWDDGRPAIEDLLAGGNPVR